MNPWSKAASCALVGLITINVSATAYYFMLKAQLRAAQPEAALEEGARFPRFNGVGLHGDIWEAGDAPCRVIRITDDSCLYCNKDRTSYSRLLDAARHASCEIVEMAPRAGGMAYDPRPGIVQLKFVDADLGAVLFPFATPQTVILDRDWSVRMTRRGMFTEESLASGVALLRSFVSE